VGSIVLRFERSVLKLSIISYPLARYRMDGGWGMGILRLPRSTVLLLVVAFTVGIVVSGFIFGLAFYAPYRMGGITATASWAEALGGYTPSAGAYEQKEEPLTRLETLNRMIIYTANLGLRVDNIDSVMNEIRNITKNLGGFVSGASMSKRDGRKIGVITIRVPQENFNAAIMVIEMLGEAESKDIRGEDVTEQYVDLRARLGNLQREEQRLTEILAMCKTVEEVLRVESELNRVRGEIERLMGQIKYLETRVDLATITVSLSEGKPWIEIPQVDWGASIKAGLWGVFTILQGLITLTIAATPFIAIGAPIYYYVYRWKKQTKTETAKN